MGLFNDDATRDRLSWTFKYTGAELLPFCQSKVAALQELEDALRNDLAKAISDRTQSVNSEEITNLKTKLGHVASSLERCQIWAHEFARKPEAEYRLGFGDVSYFDIAATQDTSSLEPDET